MLQIPFYPVTNTLYMGVIVNTGDEDMLHIMRPVAGYLAIGSVPPIQNGSGEELLSQIMKATCIDYESNKTKANQSFITNYPEDYCTVILSDYMPNYATTSVGEPVSFDLSAIVK